MIGEPCVCHGCIFCSLGFLGLAWERYWDSRGRSNLLPRNVIVVCISIFSGVGRLAFPVFGSLLLLLLMMLGFHQVRRRMMQCCSSLFNLRGIGRVGAVCRTARICSPVLRHERQGESTEQPFRMLQIFVLYWRSNSVFFYSNGRVSSL